VIVGLVFEVIWIISISLALGPERRIPSVIEGTEAAIILATAATLFGISVAVTSDTIVRRIGVDTSSSVTHER
jgi:hypothetical protein